MKSYFELLDKNYEDAVSFLVEKYGLLKMIISPLRFMPFPAHQ